MTINKSKNKSGKEARIQYIKTRIIELDYNTSPISKIVKEALIEDLSKELAEWEASE
jgi:hypothetical protein